MKERETGGLFVSAKVPFTAARTVAHATLLPRSNQTKCPLFYVKQIDAVASALYSIYVYARAFLS